MVAPARQAHHFAQRRLIWQHQPEPERRRHFARQEPIHHIRAKARDLFQANLGRVLPS